MKRFKSVLALMLVLIMALSMLNGTIILASAEGDAEPVEYRAGAGLSEGMDCMIVAEAGGASYALAIEEEALAAKEVEVVDGIITQTDKNAVWVPREEDTIENAGVPGQFIFAGSHGLMLYTGGRTFVYDAETKTILMHGMYYLTFNAETKKFDESVNIADAATITIYEPVPVYDKTDAFVEDDQFVIVAEAGGENYALSIVEEAIGAETVTVVNDRIRDPQTSVVWTAREGDSVENLGNPGQFIFAGSHGLMLYTGGRTFVYNAETKTILMHGMYYLTFNAETKKFDESVDIADAATITIYGREMPKLAKEEKFIPDGSDLPTVTREAVKNADGSITLAFITDIHYSTDYAQNNVQVWYENVSQKVGYIDALGSLGDMGSAYSSTPEIYWTNVQAVFDYLDPVVASGAIGNAIYTFGNHEWYPSAGGDFMNNYENPTAKRLFRVGEALVTNDYIIYCLGAGDIASRYSQGYSEEDINRIATYLSTARTDIPIFVLTHFPVHFWGDRKEQNADKLIDVLNNYPNVVLLWGHNHSDFDENYDMLYRPGDSIVTDLSGTTRQINFTYMSAGSMSDTEYTGAYGGSHSVLGKGLIVTINANGSLTFDYYTLEGDQMQENGPYLVEFRDGVQYKTLQKGYYEPGAAATAPEVPEFYHFTFTGWDRDYSSINRHMVVVADYDYEVLRDENYVYLTITLGDEALKDKDGDPIVLYPVPYTENMTVVDAYRALQQAAYPGEEIPEITLTSRGYFSNIWGKDQGNGALALCLNIDDGYSAGTDLALAGNCYYMNIVDEEHEAKTASFLNPEEIDAYTGVAVPMSALTWVMQPSYTFRPTPMNGDVYVGTTLDALTDSGVDAVDGNFEITFDEVGTYYVVVKQEGAADAYAIVHVAKGTEYKFLEGADSTWTKGKDGNLTFRIDGDFSKFVSVSVDGKKLATSDFAAKEGSTIVVLNKDYLSKLMEGKHELLITMSDGTAKTEFKVKASGGVSPSTGENVMLVAVSFSISALCLAGLIVLFATRKRKDY